MEREGGEKEGRREEVEREGGKKEGEEGERVATTLATYLTQSTYTLKTLSYLQYPNKTK